MIRWKLPTPKTISIVAAVCLAAWAVGPMVQFILIRAAATELGAKLSIGETSVSTFTSDLELTDVRLAHPLGSNEDRLACDSVLVDVEGTPLLRRKLVIRNATAVGLRILTPPCSAEVLTKRWPLPQHWKLHLPAQKLLQASLSDAAASTQTDPWADSGTLALLDVLSENRTQQTRNLLDDLEIYELRLERLAEITEQLAKSKAEPKPAQSAEQTLLELKALEETVYAYRKQVEESRKKFQADRQRLLSLKEQDLSRANASFQLQIPNPQVLSEFFMGQAASERSWEILRFVQWAREFLPQPQTSSVPAGTQGLTIAFPERHPLPAFVLRALHFEGKGELANTTFDFAGTLQNLTNDPQSFAEPSRLVIDAKVPHRVVVEAVLDRTKNEAHDRIVVRCPSWPQPQQMLGNPSQVGILAQPCLLSLRAELDVSGGNVSGVVQMRQQRLQLTPQVSGELGGKRVQAALVELLSQIDTIDYEVRLDGPIESPSMTLASSCGERVAGGLQHAFEKEFAMRSAESTEQLARELDARIAKWEEAASTAQQELQTRLGTTIGQVQVLDTLVQQYLPQNTVPRAKVTLRTQVVPAETTDRE